MEGLGDKLLIHENNILITYQMYSYVSAEICFKFGLIVQLEEHSNYYTAVVLKKKESAISACSPNTPFQNDKCLSRLG